MIKRVGILLGLSVAALVTVAHAQNNKPIRSGLYYEDRASRTTTGVNVLALTFAQTPTDKFLNITDVACDGYSPLDYPLNTAVLVIGTTSGSNDVGRDATIAGSTYSSNGAPYTYFAINTKTLIKVGPNRFPSIRFVFKSMAPSYFLNVNCVIVGALSDD